MNKQKRFDNWCAVFEFITREITKTFFDDFWSNDPETSTLGAFSRFFFCKVLLSIYQCLGCTKFKVSILNLVYQKSHVSWQNPLGKCPKNVSRKHFSVSATWIFEISAAPEFGSKDIVDFKTKYKLE